MITETPTIDVVYQGIYTLYNNPNLKEKEKASKWLEELQKSIYSWSIADELLSQKRDLQSCYFAAQTMRIKIQNSFHELPPAAHERLRDTLLSHIGEITSETDSIIVTQLCLAISDLALVMYSWKSPVLSLLEKLSKKEESVWALLEVLSIIPEEIDSRFLRLGANRREELHKELETSSGTVMEFLVVCLTTYLQNIEILNKIVRCFNAWITIHAISLSNVTENPIAQQVFRLLSSPDTSRKLHDSATDCLCTLLQVLESNSNQYSNQQVLEIQIFNGVLALESSYHSSVANEDTDKATNYCRIFTALGESFLEKIISNDETPHYSIKSLDLVLTCVGHYDYEIAEITFNLWYRLSEELYQKNNDQLTNHFKPYIERLLGALYRHSQMDPDSEGLIEEGDSFNDFRRKVSDLIKDVVFIIGSSNCFKQMFLILQEPSATWESSESALFVMENVAKNILPDENEIVPKVVEAILNLPENTHVAFRFTSIMLLGELCEWIENHPESLQAVLNFLLYSLQQKNGLATAAANALTSICAACRIHMTCHLNGLIEIARSLDSFEITNELAIGLLKGISIIISRLQRPQLEHALHEICSFQFAPLVQIVESGNTSVVKGNRSDPTYWIDRACAVIRHTNPDVKPSEVHPSVQILTDSWPLISKVMEKYQADVRIMERTCRFIRYGIRAVGDENEIVPKVVEAILNLPENTHVAFRFTSIMLLGELCEWIENHPESLQAVLNFLLYSLQQKNGLATAAANALTSICAACRIHMTCHLNGLIEIARSLDSFEITNELAIGLLKGISIIISRLQRPQLEHALHEICSFQFAPLVQIVESGNTSVVKGNRSDPTYWIDRACAVIRHTNPDVKPSEVHPSVQILTDSWPLISKVMEKYQADVRIMERTCRFIRYGIRAVGNQASHLLEPLVKQIVCLYAIHHHSCFLYLGSILVDEFAKSEDCTAGLLEMLQAFIEPTFNMLQVENGLKNNPDTVDDFFRLCSRFIECCPVPFLQSPLVTPILQCALLACTLDHRDANTSVMKFFCNLLRCGRPNVKDDITKLLVKQIANQNGEALIMNLIHASVFCLHSYMLADVAEVITELKAVEKENIDKYLKSALDALPNKNSGGCITATQQQLDEFSNSVLRSETTKAVTVALKDFTRLYR